MNVRALVAEAVGTFVLIAMGSLGVSTAFLMSSGQSFVLMLVVPWAFGLGLMAAIAIGGESSGGHFNPAVTLGSVLDGRTRWTTGLAYVVAQAIGAFAASLFILLVLAKEFVGATVNHAGSIAQDALTNELHAFTTEIVLTAIFVAVILTVTSRAPSRAIVVIPLTLVAIHFAGIPISGASVNPIRSLAPAVVSGDYEGLWVYLTAPFLGAIVGWGLFRLLSSSDDTDDEDEEDELEDEEFEDEEDQLDDEDELEPA
ncbi:MAG TPA: MIP/aquaporin family protein [Patescibacteria group bacterium]|jgi:aquaporin Z|nr:MIP/aquaporin family protein [Patescibacteria group bacterium]